MLKHTNLLDLEEEVVVVSGASSGIGRGCAGFLAEMGARVALLDVNDEAGRAAAAEIGANAIFVHCDVTREPDCMGAVETVVDRWGRIYGLIQRETRSSTRRASSSRTTANWRPRSSITRKPSARTLLLATPTLRWLTSNCALATSAAL